MSVAINLVDNIIRLHKENNIGEKKIDSAKKTLLSYNKDLNLITFDATLNSNNAINA